MCDIIHVLYYSVEVLCIWYIKNVTEKEYGVIKKSKLIEGRGESQTRV